MTGAPTILRGTSLPGTYLLVGHSSGFAARFPDEAAALVLIDSAAEEQPAEAIIVAIRYAG
jgi:hypothetical protein